MPEICEDPADTYTDLEFPDNWFPPKYDPDNDPHFDIDETTMFLGERRSGKTTVCTELNLKRRQLYPCVYVFTKTRQNNYWQQYVPVKKIAGDLDNDVLANMIVENGKRLLKWKIIKYETGKYKGNPLIKVIFEDMVSEHTLRSSKPLETLCFNGRHSGFSVDILTQDYVGVKRGERSNMDRWFVFRPDDDATRDWMRRSLGNRLFDVAQRVWSKGYMFMLNRKKRIPLKERVCWYESDVCYIDAATHKNLCLGNKAWWNGVDIKKQKSKYPCVDYPALATLKAKFNEKISKEDQQPEDIDEEAQKPDMQEKQAVEVKVQPAQVTTLLTK